MSFLFFGVFCDSLNPVLASFLLNHSSVVDGNFDVGDDSVDVDVGDSIDVGDDNSDNDVFWSTLELQEAAVLLSMTLGHRQCLDRQYSR